MELRQFDVAEPLYEGLLAKQEQALGPDQVDHALVVEAFYNGVRGQRLCRHQGGIYRNVGFLNQGSEVG
jgi:hypothetical protein